jgi:phosphatidylglycerol lysyltransferase
LILKYGWNTTCFQLVNPKLQHWLSGEAVVGFVKKNGYAVVAGAPVCPEPTVCETIADFEQEFHKVCYFGAEQRIRAATENDRRYCRVVLGAQPIWTPSSLVRNVEQTPSLRAQVNRARNKKVTVEEWSVAKAEGNPQLKRILDEWLTTRGLPTMHFLVEPETLNHLEGRRVFVAIQAETPIAFLGLSPIPARHGWLTEQFPRGHSAPNGTVELLMLVAAETVRNEGAELITMGIVPLAEKSKDATADNPSWLRLVTAWARAHGRRFYNFEGLEWFKDKFQPDEWEPIYAISKEDRFSLWTLYAIAAAFTDAPPPIVLAKGLWRALRSELRSLRRSLSKRVSSAKSQRRG